MGRNKGEKFRENDFKNYFTNTKGKLKTKIS